MECVHCKKSFSKDTFDAHCREHAEIQTRLKRPTGRTYGARYESKDPDSHVLPPEEPRPQKQKASSLVPSNAGSSVRLNEERLPNHQSALDGLDKRIHSIIESFPPYGDSVEAPWPETTDFACKDCSFKFRTKKECDEHYLSKYCHGADVVSYSLIIDRSQPCGYKVEKNIQPLDGIKFPSLFQCQKCSSMFPTELEMESHQKTHLVSPSRCLHCQKMFSTKYELDDHYDWHDDMDYRQRIDRLSINNKNHETGELNEPKNIQVETLSLASDMQNMSFPSPADNGKSQEFPKHGCLGGKSFISAEDVERLLAPNGYYEVPPTQFTHIRGLDGEVADEVWTMPAPSPTPGITVSGHGLPGYMLVVDVAGRKRWVKGGGIARLFREWSEGPETMLAHLEAADGLEEGGELLQAMNSQIEALGVLVKLDSDAFEEVKCIMLAQIAVLAQKLNLFEVGVEYNLRALELSVKQFSKDSVNNFQLINNLGVLFDKHGMLKEAAYLYRRSLLGRMKIKGPDHADTLMTMQELASVSLKLGNANAARSLLEISYIGHENLQEPNERATMGTLIGLAVTYNMLGRAHHAIGLLEPAVPRMRRAFGLGDETTCGVIRTLLQFTQGDARDTKVASMVRDLIREMQEDMTDPGSMAIRSYADLLARNRRLGEAEGLYRKVYDWRTARFGGSDDETIQCLYGLAYCLELLQKIPEAEEEFQKLARVTADSQENQKLYQISIRAVARLSAKKDQLRAESTSWGLEKPGRCPCGKNTTRFCSSCQMKHFCSSNCQEASEEHKHCYPSVTPQQSISTTRQAIDVEELEYRFQGLFRRDPKITRAPKLISSEALFVDPTCFATVRIWKDPTRLVSYYFAGMDIRIAFGNVGSIDWQPASRMGTMYLYPSTEADPVYLLVAPGESMFRSAKSEWVRTTGVNVEIDLPDSGMIEYLQSKEPQTVKMKLAVIMMVWET